MRGADDISYFVRLRKEIGDAVQEFLNTLVLEGRSHEDRRELQTNRGLANRLLQDLGRNLFLHQKEIGNLVVDFRERLNELVSLRF